MFAIITYRHSGPIKTWSAMKAANIHNARTKPLRHAMPNAPKPRHLIGTGDLVADVKDRLRAFGIDPAGIRKNGVIAYEAILSASPAFFEQGSPAEQIARLDAWTDAQVVWALEKYGAHRIVSMVLHVDEKTPHAHLVVLPLAVGIDNRRIDKSDRWALVGRTISGPGMYDEVQDEYSKAMEVFGLVRGVKVSGRKHEPVPVYLARMAGKERAVDAARVAVDLEAADVGRERDHNAQNSITIKAGFAGLQDAAIKFHADCAAFEAEKVGLQQAWLAHADAVAQHLQDRHEQRRGLERDRGMMLATIAEERQRAATDAAALEMAKADHAAKVTHDERRLVADRETLSRHHVELASMRAALSKDVAAQRVQEKATARALEDAVRIRNDAEADREAAAADRTRARVMADKVNAHRNQLLPAIQAANEFRREMKLLKGQPLTPQASSTQAAVQALQAAASAVTAPSNEVRPEMLASYETIRERASAMDK